MMFCATSARYRPASSDDSHRPDLRHGLPHAHAEVGDRSYERGWHGDTWRARQSPRRAGPLYLALEADTAVREYQQVSPLMPPGTLVSYTVSAKAMVDFRRGYDSVT